MIFAFGTKTGFEDTPETFKLAAEICASPTVNASAGVEVLCTTAWFGILEIVGAVLVEETAVRVMKLNWVLGS